MVYFLTVLLLLLTMSLTYERTLHHQQRRLSDPVPWKPYIGIMETK